MKKTLTELIIGASLLGLTGCAGLTSRHSIPQFSKTPVYAKNEYEQHPQFRKEIALYNIKNILSDVCDSSGADEQGFFCQMKGKCKDYTYSAPVSNPYQQRGGSIRTSQCADDEKINASWNRLRYAWQKGHCVELITTDQQEKPEDRGRICTRDSKQAEGLKSAINWYLK